MTSSRHRENVATIFDVFCEVGAAEPGGRAPLLTKYPEDFNDISVIKSIQQFAFPYNMKSSENDAVQLFSFVLTDSESKYSFGFCRYTPRNDTCICMLSGFFWPNVFYSALNEISLVMNSASQKSMESFLTRMYHTDIPNPGDVLKFSQKSGNASFNFEARIPDPTKLPSLREEKYMLEFYNAVSARQLIAIYSSLLKERRIIITGRKLSQLSSCIHACAMLLNPMCWQSVFIPVLPESLFEMIMAPMPYLIGVPKQILEANNLKDIGDVVVVDIDAKTLESHVDDVVAMPNDVVNFLKNQLKGTIDMNDSFSRIFLRANVILFGDYRAGFLRDSQQKVVWNKEKFINEQKSSYREYLTSLLGADGVQYLERFIYDRVQKFNDGQAIKDNFEIEIDQMDLKNKQNPNAESLQLAMLSVRENASDVIGVIKDKVSGIQITNKLNKLTPKEIRKAASKKKMNGSDIPPMSFDNMQWEKTRKGELEKSPIEIEQHVLRKSDNEVPTANLIDFDSPITNKNVSNEWNEFLSTVPKPSGFPTNLKTYDAGVNNQKIFTDPFSAMNTPVTNQPTSSAGQTSHSQSYESTFSRSNWEKFD